MINMFITGFGFGFGIGCLYVAYALRLKENMVRESPVEHLP